MQTRSAFKHEWVNRYHASWTPALNEQVCVTTNPGCVRLELENSFIKSNAHLMSAKSRFPKEEELARALACLADHAAINALLKECAEKYTEHPIVGEVLQTSQQALTCVIFISCVSLPETRSIVFRKDPSSSLSMYLYVRLIGFAIPSSQSTKYAREHMANCVSGDDTRSLSYLLGSTYHKFPGCGGANVTVNGLASAFLRVLSSIKSKDAYVATAFSTGPTGDVKPSVALTKPVVDLNQARSIVEGCSMLAPRGKFTLAVLPGKGTPCSNHIR